MRKDQRNLVLSVALAGTVLATIASPVAAATPGAASDAFLKIDVPSVLIPGDPAQAADAFFKF